MVNGMVKFGMVRISAETTPLRASNAAITTLVQENPFFFRRAERAIAMVP